MRIGGKIQKWGVGYSSGLKEPASKVMFSSCVSFCGVLW